MTLKHRIRLFHESLVHQGGKATQVQCYGSTMSALENADALVIMTEGNEFWQPDFSLLAQPLRRRVIFDGRNIYDPDIVAGYGLDYFGVGRSSIAR